MVESVAATTFFTGAVSVTFGGTAAQTFTITSDTSITATTSAGAAGSASIVQPTDQYTYN
jgi:hypothetical protein